MNEPIDVGGALPDRPLTVREVGGMADAAGVEAVEPVMYQGERQGVVCFLVVSGSVAHTFGWRPGRDGGWKILRAVKVG